MKGSCVLFLLNLKNAENFGEVSVAENFVIFMVNMKRFMTAKRANSLILSNSSFDKIGQRPARNSVILKILV